MEKYDFSKIPDNLNISTFSTCCKLNDIYRFRIIL